MKKFKNHVNLEKLYLSRNQIQFFDDIYSITEFGTFSLYLLYI
ncbi:hypothetical protein FH5_01689 [Priestia endophytica]|nr:hypothetical protein FH5_01689 [Priestia endophytica]